ncbi:MAG: YgeY family selenium metabolism-linked hydrolase, partial [candidate division Zixibacteria bacterium]|nr:YgeY family selenium metabolism-linked hydrolase [candidate division Zixibacteria bacterium]NIS48286.1 YgeY family selenium metabolism-linked hydrolase [candidate division Zixibacteria bacterium]NIU16404.1 YgeY family selenium metabolism-linked hydrolase [candidate division Zixibacteria bacterium]NIV08525.1 YgeY family selenium metabolism-linked hydrolase [candidate division Zixibacteria bacterium]NIW42030.1 YgeY family selenium metabolism-linked hydrolase [candidate division Zixibacteria ba
MTNEIMKLARDLESDLVTFLQELVAIPSRSEEEVKVLERIKQE